MGYLGAGSDPSGLFLRFVTVAEAAGLVNMRFLPFPCPYRLSRGPREKRTCGLTPQRARTVFFFFFHAEHPFFSNRLPVTACQETLLLVDRAKFLIFQVPRALFLLFRTAASGAISAMTGWQIPALICGKRLSNESRFFDRTFLVDSIFAPASRKLPVYKLQSGNPRRPPFFRYPPASHGPKEHFLPTVVEVTPTKLAAIDHPGRYRRHRWSEGVPPKSALPFRIRCFTLK